MQSIWKNIDLGILIVGSVFIIPFLYSSHTADPLLTPRFLAWGGVCFGLFLSVMVKDLKSPEGQVQDLFHDPIFMWLTLYLVISLISLTMAVNVGEGFVHWLKSFLFLAFLYGASLTLGTSTKRLQWLIQSIILAGIALGAVGWIQWGFPDILKIPGYFDVYGTMGNKNLYASALFLFLPFLLFAIFHYRGAWRHLALGAVIVIGFGIVITRTRSVWLAVVLSGMVVGLTTPVKKRCMASLGWVFSSIRSIFFRPIGKYGEQPLLGGYWLLGVAAALVFVWPTMTNGRAPISSDLISTASMKDRTVLWENTIKMVLNHPFRGVGPGQWKLHLPKYGCMERQFLADGVTYEVTFQRPHNDYLWVAAESGLPGLICILFFSTGLIQRCYGIIRHADDPGTQQLATCMLFGVLGFMVISFFSFPHERIFHNVFLGLISAVILSTYHCRNGGRPKKAPILNRWRCGLILGLCVGCAAVGYSRYRSDRYIRNALRARNSAHHATVITQLTLAQTWLTTLDPTATPLAWYRAMANYHLGNLELAQVDFVSACKAHPYHFHSLNNAAECYALAGDWAVANHYRKRVEQLASWSSGH